MLMNFQNEPEKFQIVDFDNQPVKDIDPDGIPVLVVNKEDFDIVLGEGVSAMTISSGVS